MPGTRPQIVVSPPSFALTDDVHMHIVLVEPEIPQNAGSVARLCAGARAWLHFVEPTGFILADRYLKRAGLDYWPAVRLSVHPSLDALEAMLPRERTWLLTKRGRTLYREASLPQGTVFVFGRESAGLPQAFCDRWDDRQLRIPTTSDVRSLNLANAVGIVAWEALRQLEWAGETPMES